MSVPSVSALLYSGCPSAIRWFVVTVVVDAFKCMSVRRLTPHVGNEIIKLGPARANRNAAFTVVFPARHSLVCAARSHVYPGAVFGSSPTTHGVAMTSFTKSNGLASIAAAALRFLAPKVLAVDDSFGSAIATT